MVNVHLILCLDGFPLREAGQRLERGSGLPTRSLLAWDSSSQLTSTQYKYKYKHKHKYTRQLVPLHDGSLRTYWPQIYKWKDFVLIKRSFPLNSCSLISKIKQNKQNIQTLQILFYFSLFIVSDHNGCVWLAWQLRWKLESAFYF